MVKYNELGEIAYLNRPKEVFESFLRIYCKHNCDTCKNDSDCKKLKDYIAKTSCKEETEIEIQNIIWNIKFQEVLKSIKEFNRRNEK